MPIEPVTSRGIGALLREGTSYRETKSEIRSTKSETNPKSKKQIRNEERNWCLSQAAVPVISSFGFRICFGFRVSDFGFPIEPSASRGQLPDFDSAGGDGVQPPRRQPLV